MQHRLALATTLVALVAAAPAAAADAPAHSVTTPGTSTVQVPQNTPHNDAAIAAAIAAARQRAEPDAIAKATTEAQRLAASLGWTIGAMTNVSEATAAPFGFSVYGQDGTFGPGRYCGTIRTAIFHKGKNGRRVFTHRFRSHHGCRIPSSVTQTVNVTFAAA